MADIQATVKDDSLSSSLEVSSLSSGVESASEAGQVEGSGVQGSSESSELDGAIGGGTTPDPQFYVPYIGAIKNTDLGVFDLTTTGDITGGNLNIAQWNTAYGWGDHSTVGYALESQIVNRANWDTAYGWGDHALAGYALQSEIANKANWDTAYSWGDHSLAGYALESQLLWQKNGTDLEPLTSTDNINLSGGGVYKIADSQVLMIFGNSIFCGTGGASLTNLYGYNSIFGLSAAPSLIGSRNNGIGYGVFQDAVDANKNQAMGAFALSNLIDGEGDTAVGNQAMGGSLVLHTNYTTAIAYQAGQQARGDYSLHLGYRSGYYNTRDYTLTIGDTYGAGAGADPLIYGEFDNELLGIYGDLWMPDDRSITFGNIIGTPNVSMKWVDADSEFKTTVGNTIITLASSLVTYTTTNFSFYPAGVSVLWSNYSFKGGTTMRNKRAQGVKGAEESIVNGAILNQYVVEGYHEGGAGPGGGAYYTGAEQRYTVDGAIGASAEVPTRWELFLTPENSTTLATALKVNSNKTLTTYGGKINKTTRVTSGPYSILVTDDEIFVDTDGGAIILNLPAGVNGQSYRIINCGSSSNDMSIAPNGAELLRGFNASIDYTDESEVIITYETTEGWW